MIRNLQYAKLYKYKQAALAFFIIGLGIIFMTIRSSYFERRAFNSYVPTQAQITDIEKYKIGKETYANITYKYFVDGIMFEGNANRVYNGEKAGDTKVAYYEKLNPTHLVIKANNPNPFLITLSVISMLIPIFFIKPYKNFENKIKEIKKFGTKVSCTVTGFEKDLHCMSRRRISKVITVRADNGSTYESINIFGYVSPDIVGAKCSVYLYDGKYFVDVDELT